MEIIDAYTHCGRRKYEPIEKVREVMAAADASRAVLVQHMGEFDNTYLEQVVAEDREHLVGVCLVNHEAKNAVETLRSCAESGGFKGVRYSTEVCVDAAYLMEAAVELGLIIVLYAPESISAFVHHLASFLDGRPAARLVITHLGNPNVHEAPDFERYRDVFRLADYPGVYYQVSGMGQLCPYPYELFYGLITQAVERFGPLRLCWGSNYPVVGSKEDYIKDLRLLLDGKLPVPDDAIPHIAGGNAARLWFGM